MNAKTKWQLVSVATRYDERESRRPHWNRYALPQYLQRISEIEQLIDTHDAPLREAIMAGFSGRLSGAMVRSVGEPAFTVEEQRMAERKWHSKLGTVYSI